MLKGKRIILGVTGSIAAYKAALLVRLLVKQGAEVQVLITEAGKEFITPLTLATLSLKPVLSDFFEEAGGSWNSHVDMGIWANAFIVAPASANSLAKMAHGIADNLLLTTYLSARCPVFIAPAMDLDMYQHPATQENVQILQNRGVKVIEATTGELASGLQGKGRMQEPEEIVNVLNAFFAKKTDFAGKNILITAGPTHEKIDPVRFIGNYSSGKMGYALAQNLAERGANVHIVSGPVQIKAQHLNIKVSNVESAKEMYQVSKRIFAESDIGIFAAAVADYSPETTDKQKVKRTNSDLQLRLKANKDIAAELSSTKKSKQITIGFALETNNEHTNAVSKLKRKNLDFIVLNSLQDKGAGFGGDTNKITIFDTNGNISPYGLESKSQTAKNIVDYLAKTKL